MNLVLELLLVGAGGHAAGVVEAAIRAGHRIVAYSDNTQATWLPDFGKMDWYATDTKAIAALANNGFPLVIGLGGTNANALASRLGLLDRYLEAEFEAPCIAHPDATVSKQAEIGVGVTILGRVIVHPFAKIGRGAIVNSSAIIEHHAVIGEGAHIAPAAVVLGNASIGECAVIGANAVVLPGASIPDGTLVKAGSVYG